MKSEMKSLAVPTNLFPTSTVLRVKNVSHSSDCPSGVFHVKWSELLDAQCSEKSHFLSYTVIAHHLPYLFKLRHLKTYQHWKLCSCSLKGNFEESQLWDFLLQWAEFSLQWSQCLKKNSVLSYRKCFYQSKCCKWIFQPQIELTPKSRWIAELYLFKWLNCKDLSHEAVS